MPSRTTRAPSPAPPALLLIGALLIGPTACGKDAPLKKPDRAAAQCQRLQERNVQCWNQMQKQFSTMLLLQGIRRVQVAPKDQRKQLLANRKEKLQARLKVIRKTLVDQFVPHCKQDWRSSKPAHRRLKRRMMECLAKPTCKAYAECFGNLHGK